MIEQLAPLYGISLFILTLVIADMRKTYKVHSCQKKVERALIHMFPQMEDLLK